ncbi:MAG: alpha-ribazole phosphatase [Carboxylicivirga sp.]|jgi:alpha-ribazole phosphatase|nr:alpha-ribazole phosphatase [Carboxylicivirga sp.]
MELWLIRHTTPEVEQGICYGQLDLEVNGNFDQESKEIKTFLSNTSFDKIYSSPLKRCHKLAQRLFDDEEIIIDERLKEINFGEWEGLMWKDIKREALDNWGNDFIHQKPPQGESFGELIDRVNQFIEATENTPGKRIAIVTHSGIIRAFLLKYLDIPPLKIFNLDLSYGAVVRVNIHSDKYQQVKFIKG